MQAKEGLNEVHQKLNRFTLGPGIGDDFYLIFYDEYALCFNAVALICG